MEVVHDLFEEQTSVDNVVRTIMQRAQTLLKCERCVVMLKDQSDDATSPPPGNGDGDLRTGAPPAAVLLSWDSMSNDCDGSGEVRQNGIV